MKYMLIIVMFAAMIGANAYVFYRIWHLLPPLLWLRWIVLIVGLLAFASMFLAILAGDNFPVPLTSVLYRVGTSWLVIMLYLLIVFLVLDLLRATHLLPVSGIYGNWTGTLGVTFLVAAAMVAGNLIYHNKKRVELTIDTNGMLPVQLKIVAASDLHLGYGIGNRELEKWVDMINAENPDLIVFAGDIIDNSVKPLYEQDMAALLRRLNAKHGVWASLGNHEYISGVEPSLAFLQEAGIRVLRDESVSIDGMLSLVGRDDATNHYRKSLHELLATIDGAIPAMVLDHQPTGLDSLAGENVALQLSGHTHRGQVWPLSWITDAIFENSHGLLEKYGTSVYVSSGLGIWGGKFRIGTRSEYMVITFI